MSRWFRWYAGTVEDVKLRRVTRYSGVTLRDVTALWALLLEDASNDDHRGACNRSNASVTAALEFEAGVVERILMAMQSVGMVSVSEEHVTISNWGKRQFDTDRRDGTNAERQRRYRQRKAAEGSGERNGIRNGAVTSRAVTGKRFRNGFRNGTPNGPDTDTDTDSVSKLTQTEFVTGPGENSANSPPPDTAASAAAAAADLQITVEQAETELRSAAGPHAPKSHDISPILALTRSGYDLRREVVPAVAEAAAKSQKPISSWRYFVGPIQDRRSRNGNTAPPAETPSEPVVWVLVESPLWPAIAERYRTSRGHELRPAGSKHEAGLGAFVPAAWLSP